MDKYNLISFFGIFIIAGIGWLFSSNRRGMNWRVISLGIILQLGYALFIFTVPSGTKIFLLINDVVIRVLDSALAGAQFVFGRLALPPGSVNAAGESSLGFMLAFQAFPTIIFFSALISVLYFYKIMPVIIRGFAWVFTKSMSISGAESLVAASNIFTGVEAALTVKPYLNRMTNSELCMVLSTGMATVSANVMVLYVLFLKDHVPAIAGHLMTASVLSAIAAIVMSKIIYPESEVPETLGVKIPVYQEREKTLFEAIINGSQDAVKMIAGITALLIAVLGLMSLADTLIALVNPAWSLKAFLSLVFYPLTLILGIPPADAGVIAGIIGERTILTEVVSFQDLSAAIAKNLISNPRSVLIAVYALCGFAHIASVAIFVGGTAALAPDRKGDLSRLGLRALIAATLACLMSACVIGTFVTESGMALK